MDLKLFYRKLWKRTWQLQLELLELPRDPLWKPGVRETTEIHRSSNPKLQNSEGRALQGAKWLFPPLPQVGCHEVSVKVAMYVLFIPSGCRGEGSRWYAISWGMRFNIYIFSVDLWQLQILYLYCNFQFHSHVSPACSYVVLPWRLQDLGFYSNSRLSAFCFRNISFPLLFLGCCCCFNLFQTIKDWCIDHQIGWRFQTNGSLSLFEEDLQMSRLNHQPDRRHTKNLPTFLVDVGQEATFPIATSEIAAELPTTTATGEVSRDHVVRDVGVRDGWCRYMWDWVPHSFKWLWGVIVWSCSKQ